MPATPASAPAEVLLAAVEDLHAVESAAAVRKMQLAVEWVLAHPGEEVDTTIAWEMRELQIAGDGAPTVDEGAVAEFAHAIGLSTDAAKAYLGDAVELAFRLPRTWGRVLAGEVVAWKARRIAQLTSSLPMDGARAVDTALWFVAARCSYAEVERQVEKARKAHDPEETERRRLAALEKRRVTINLRRITPEGLVPIEAWVDAPDALALDQAIREIAATLDPSLSMDARRAVALGVLADRANAGGAGAPGRDLVLYLHARPGHSMVEVDDARTTTTVDQVREWCQRAGTRVTVKPVIDLNEELSTDVHDPTDAMREQVRLRYGECSHPGCHRPARDGDVDHIVAWPEGPTTSSNLAPLCRTHHRLKTHTAWSYRHDEGVGFVWTSPHGRTYRSRHPG